MDAAFESLREWLACGNALEVISETFTRAASEIFCSIFLQDMRHLKIYCMEKYFKTI